MASLAAQMDAKALRWAEDNPAYIERTKRRAALKKRMKKRLKQAQKLMRQIAKLDVEPMPESNFTGVKIGETISVPMPSRFKVELGTEVGAGFTANMTT